MYLIGQTDEKFGLLVYKERDPLWLYNADSEYPISLFIA
jgi:hypothetical protein